MISAQLLVHIWLLFFTFAWANPVCGDLLRNSYLEHVVLELPGIYTLRKASPNIRNPKCGPICALNARQAVRLAKGIPLDPKPVETLHRLQETTPELTGGLRIDQFDELLEKVLREDGDTKFQTDVLSVPQVKVTDHSVIHENLDLSVLLAHPESTKIAFAHIINSEGKPVDAHFFNIRAITKSGKNIELIASDPQFPERDVRYSVESITVNDNQNTIGLTPIGQKALSDYGDNYRLVLGAVTSIFIKP